MEEMKLVLAGVAAIIGCFSALMALSEHRKQGVARRAEIFLKVRARLRDDPVFREICELLEIDSPKLKEFKLIDRDRFLGVFEEIAWLKNSGLINDVACVYMFGYYAVRCESSEYFWAGMNKDNHTLWR